MQFILKVCVNALEIHEEMFHGTGKLAWKQVKLHMDETVQPVALRHGWIPFRIRKLVEEELADPEERDIIENVDSTTP